MFTDPNHLRKEDPGKVEGNPVFIYHDAFNPDVDDVPNMKEHYQRGGLGDVEVKKKLVVAINNLLDPIRERRALLRSAPEGSCRRRSRRGARPGARPRRRRWWKCGKALKLDYFKRGMPS